MTLLSQRILLRLRRPKRGTANSGWNRLGLLFIEKWNATNAPSSSGTCIGDSQFNGLAMRRNPLEAVAAGAVEGASQFSVGWTVTVGGVGSDRLFVEDGFRFATLKLSGLAVWTASAAFVGGCCRNVCAASLDLKKLLDAFQSQTTTCLQGWRVGDDDALGRTGKQNHAKWG